MDLIIKPTIKCNFRCTFCSSTDITNDSSDLLPIEQIETFLKRFPNTKTIIVNGGDGLVLQPNYYFKIIDILDRLNMDTTLSFTSNLYPFYLKPDKWLPLFRHPRVGVTTSFQYQGRLKHDYTEYTEEEFREVFHLFLDKVGYKLDFISVLTNETGNDWYRLVKLAEDLGVTCKLNYANSSGTVVQSKQIEMGYSNDHYAIADAYQIYTYIYYLGLEQYEHNTQQLVKTLQGSNTICPLKIECDKGIRCLQPSGDYYSCGSFGDDKLFPIDFNKEMNQTTLEEPLTYEDSLRVMKEDCYTCYNFNICNGCKRGIYDAKNKDRVEYHCSKMKSLIPDFINISKGIRLPEKVVIPNYSNYPVFKINTDRGYYGT